MPLRVLLAGHSVDVDALREVREALDLILKEADPRVLEQMSLGEARRFLADLYRSVDESLAKQALTPEVLSAAYARISRDPKSIPELRRAAREGIARARKSNEAIIFGMGHASVAEHATFNFDILGLSRLATEDLQAHRLVSFTEKSQRYITASDEYVLPEELKAIGWEDRFRSEIQALFSEYRFFFERLHARIIEKEGQASESTARRDQENRAKEDARYLLPLATSTQMGTTLTARNLEYILQDCNGHELAEMRLLGQKLLEAARPLAPSLVKHTGASAFPRKNRHQLRLDYSVRASPRDAPILQGPSVTLLSADSKGERVVAEALAFRNGIRLEADNVPPHFWRTILKGMTLHDAAPREFELATLQFEVTASASCYAQLKRHRMMTLLPAAYRANDGIVLPAAVAEAGLSGRFKEAVRRAGRACEELAEEAPFAAAYLLTNAHVRRARLQVNARELYHVARLREDQQAQWEIRQLAGQMVAEARRLWPNLMALACGKDQFEAFYGRFFGSDREESQRESDSTCE